MYFVVIQLAFPYNSGLSLVFPFSGVVGFSFALSELALTFAKAYRIWLWDIVIIVTKPAIKVYILYYKYNAIAAVVYYNPQSIL